MRGCLSPTLSKATAPGQVIVAAVTNQVSESHVNTNPKLRQVISHNGTKIIVLLHSEWHSDVMVYTHMVSFCCSGTYFANLLHNYNFVKHVREMK